MNKSEREKKVIENYQSDEKIMILIFAQWCINHDLNARQLYEETYPEQMKNQELIDAMEQTVPKEVADVIDDGVRSEEHTSELQSRGHLVCRLLLEKKK